MAAMTELNLSELLLLSGNDIPFQEAQVFIHQPTLKEIALIGGEEEFFAGCELLKFSKDILSPEDKNKLSNIDDFQIFMSIMMDSNNSSTQKSVESAIKVLTLLFGKYTIGLCKEGISLTLGDEVHYINQDNFNIFKEIMMNIFCLKRFLKDQSYKPKGVLAQQIAEKLAKGRQQAAATRGQGQQKISIFSRYISILTVGEHKDMNELLNYTVFQLFDEFSRFQLKMAHDIYVKSKLAGATKIEEPKDWMGDLYQEEPHKDSLEAWINKF